MPTYKLMYFDAKALGEPIRFLFHYGGVKFEDYRYSLEEWQTELKPKVAPFGQGPLLKVDDQIFWQSMACQRYVAELVGVAGNDNKEKLQVDMWAESIWDVRCVIFSWLFDQPENKTAKEDYVFKDRLPFMMERLDKQLAGNGGHFVGGKITWPDLQYTAYYEYLNHMAGRDIEGGVCPNLKALRAKVSQIPGIEAWLQDRPKTEW